MKSGKRKVGKTNIFGLTFRPAEKLNPENLVPMQFSVFSIKHDLARSCFQLWPKIGDEGDKISREKNWRSASQDISFSHFLTCRSIYSIIAVIAVKSRAVIG